MTEPELTPADLDRLEALTAAATPGPWKPNGRRYVAAIYPEIGAMEDTRDRDLVVETRNKITALVAGYRRMLALEALREAVQGLDSVDMGGYYHVTSESWEALFQTLVKLEKPDAD